MKTFNAIFLIDGEVVFKIPFIDKKNIAYQVYSQNADIVDVNHFVFEPKAGDYWDKETGLLVPNYIKRNKKIYLKTDEEKENMYYFAYIDKEGTVLLRQSWLNNGSSNQDYVISVFKNNPDITLEEVEDDFYDDEELEKMYNYNAKS
jgi:hypothetical protein